MAPVSGVHVVGLSACFFCFFSAYAQKYPSVSYHIILTGAALTGAESAELQEVLEETNVRVAVVQ